MKVDTKQVQREEGFIGQNFGEIFVFLSEFLFFCLFCPRLSVSLSSLHVTLKKPQR